MVAFHIRELSKKNPLLCRKKTPLTLLHYTNSIIPTGNCIPLNFRSSIFLIYQRKPNQIKNFFHNSIRNLALRLQKAEKSNKKFQRNVINTSSLHLLLNITFGFKKFQEKIEEKYKKLSIFSVYDFILYHCFENVEAAEEELF